MKSNVKARKEHGILVLLIMLIITYSMTIGNQNAVSRDLLVYVTFGINGLTWVLLFLNEVKKRAFSLIMVFWFFCVFFFFFAGLMQTVNNKFPWIKTYDDNILIKTNLVLFFWTILFQMGILFSDKVVLHKYSEGKIRKEKSEFRISTHLIMVLTVLTVIITLYRIVSIGFVNLLARGTSSYAISENASVSILLSKMMTAVVYYAFIYSIYDYQNTKQMHFLVINGICLLISYFPTSAARNAIAGIYFGALLAFFQNWKRKNTFAILYSLIFMIAFPFLNAFRTASILNVNLFNALTEVLNSFSNEWLAVDYDAYSMVALTLKYTSDHGVSMGRQLIGVLLFWIPRSIWKSKPISTGPAIAEYYGWWFTNVSEPLPAEMIENFGVIGMLFTAVTCGFVIKKLDDKYWKNRDIEQNTIQKFDSLYYYMIGYSLFVYRGALLSAFAYLVPLIVMWFICTAQIPLQKSNRTILQKMNSSERSSI